jgi:hypothetical protein
VFTRTSDGWSQQSKLTAGERGPDDWFGASVALSGDGLTALVGAENDEDPNGDGSGSAYVFVRDGATWRQTAKFSAEEGDPFDSFGASGALSRDGDVALVGAFRGGPNGSSAGSVYVFTRAGSDWVQQAELVARDGSGGDRFGVSVALSTDSSTALVGAENDDGFSGSAYVFDV